MIAQIKDKLSGFLLRKMNALIAQLQEESVMGNIYDQILKLKRLNLVVHGNFETSIPNTKPLILVCNHPLGILDGLILGALAKQNNLTFKIIANEFLLRLEFFNRDFIGVNPYGTKTALTRNIAPLKETFSWLNNNNTLIVFPAGEVAQFQFKKMRIVEAPWIESIGKIIQRSNADVLPIYIKGRNSSLFYILKCMHSVLGSLCLCKEFVDKVNQSVEIRIGDIIEPTKLKQFTDTDELMRFLRKTTLSLDKDN